jgi:hypothetical protein
MLSCLFTSDQNLLQISILSLAICHRCSLLFARVAARLLHADPALSAKLSYLPDQYIS